MRRLFFTPILLIFLFTSACGSAAIQSEPFSTQVPSNTEALIGQVTPTAEPPTQTATPPPTALPSLTPTPTAIPTETSLPPLELPSVVPNPPTLAVWDGLPTYLGDSQPGYYFRVLFDPEVWAQVVDQFGQPALGHRGIEYCTITPSTGRGLPPTVQMEHDVIYFKDLTFDVGRGYENGVLTFITYQGGNGTILTGFQVDFKDQSEACQKDALAVLSTLQAVLASQATPQP